MGVATRWKTFSVAVGVAVMLGLWGCQETPKHMFHAGDTAGLETANEDCLTLFSNTKLAPLKGKAVYLPDDIPTPAMLKLNDSPDNESAEAVKLLEEINQTCDGLRKDAGFPPSASERIKALRLSKLRYGLYNGDIPYAVYNYGVAQVIREDLEFRGRGRKAFAQGREIGEKAAAQDLQASMNSFNSLYANKTWHCSGTSFGTSYNFTCY